MRDRWGNEKQEAEDEQRKKGQGLTVRQGRFWGNWGNGGVGTHCLPGVFKISHDNCHVLEITAA